MPVPFLFGNENGAIKRDYLDANFAAVSQGTNYFVAALVNDGTLNGAGTDNSARLQAAINLLNPNGGSALFIPPGIYKLSSSVQIPSGVTVIGAGKWSTIFVASASFADNAGLFNINGSGGFPTNFGAMGIVGAFGGVAGNAIVCSKNGASLRDLWVNGFTSNTGITLSSTDISLTDFLIEICALGLNLTQSDCLVSNGVVETGSTGGVQIANAAAGQNGPLQLTNIKVSICPLFGVQGLAGAKNVMLTNVSVTHVNGGQFVTAGFDFNTSSDIMLSGCRADVGTVSAAGVGMRFSGCSNVQIIGGEVKRFFDGIRTDTACSNILISGVAALLNARRGIYVNGGDRINIVGNTCTDNGTAGAATDAGIYSDNSGAFCQHLVSSNIVTQNGAGPQDYGVFANLTNNAASSGFSNVIGNMSKFNNVAGIGTSGLVANITQTGNV